MIDRRTLPLWAVFLLGVSLSLSVHVHAENSVTVASGFAGAQQIAEVPLLISTDLEAHGFILVFEWDEDLGLGEELVPRAGEGEVLGDADIVVTHVMPSHMIFGVVMNSDTAGCEMIPAGQDIEVGVAKIRCLGGGDQREESSIRLVDGKYRVEEGLPLLDNVFLHNARFVTVRAGTLVLHDGTLICTEDVEPGSSAFACGGMLGPDGHPTDVEASAGERVEVDFYYRAPGLGLGDHRDQIQGLSIAVTHDCRLSAVEDGFSITGSVLEEVGAEFVNIDYDTSDADGDGCEFILGVLVDAEPPFDGRTLPATDQFRRLFSQAFEVRADAPAGECLAIDFTDGIQGNGMVPTKNLVSVNFESSSPDLFNCAVCVVGAGEDVEFVRGDCNFSTTSGTPVDIADAAAMVGFFFLEAANHFPAPCEDACDANDDGLLDVADVVFILEYMFVAGSPPPPDPGPLEPGFDPTEDDLGCPGP